MFCNAATHNLLAFPWEKDMTVRLIETVRLFLLEVFLRSYCTFNRVVLKNVQTVRLIETWLIIETIEYEMEKCQLVSKNSKKMIYKQVYEKGKNSIIL